MRALVCGGRKFADVDLLTKTLDMLHVLFEFKVVIHGAASGADTLAHKWAMANGIDVRAFPADWKGGGRSAGPYRNRKMLVEGKPDLVIAFAGGKGTKNMVQQARKAGVAVQRMGRIG